MQRTECQRIETTLAVRRRKWWLHGNIRGVLLPVSESLLCDACEEAHIYYRKPSYSGTHCPFKPRHKLSTPCAVLQLSEVECNPILSLPKDRSVRFLVMSMSVM